MASAVDMIKTMGLTEAEKWAVLHDLLTAENCLLADQLVSDSLRGRVFYCWDCRDFKDISLGFYLKPKFDVCQTNEYNPSLCRRAAIGAGRIADDTDHVLGRCDSCGYSSCRYHTESDSTEVLIVYCNYCTVDSVACMSCVLNYKWSCPCGSVYNNVNQPSNPAAAAGYYDSEDDQTSEDNETSEDDDD